MEYHVNINDTVIIHYGSTNKAQKFVIKRMSVEPWVVLQEVKN